jgi:hypothetical protein
VLAKVTVFEGFSPFGQLMPPAITSAKALQNASLDFLPRRFASRAAETS